MFITLLISNKSSCQFIDFDHFYINFVFEGIGKIKNKKSKMADPTWLPFENMTFL